MFSAGRRTWSRFVRLSKLYVISERRRQALGLLALLATLLLIISGLNVVNSFVGRDFMTAIVDRHSHEVYVFALIYLGVFAAATTVEALSRYVELYLGLRWREWLTGHFFREYLSGHAYYWLNMQDEVDNPDQRISEDIRTFTSTTLSFLILASQSAIAILAFSGVLWSITPWLFVAAVLYPFFGTGLIVVIGRRLVELNNLQLKKEADLRYELVYGREHAESVALAQAEKKERSLLTDRLRAVVANYEWIIAVLFRLKLATGGYNYLTQLIPVLIAAPLYLRGDADFGVVPQAAMAFSQVFNAFSLIAEQFQDLSTYAAVIGRLGGMQEAIVAASEPAQRAIQLVERDSQVAYQRVTLRAREDNRLLVRDLSLELPRGRCVLVKGPKGPGPNALFRATAGLWDNGSGWIVRPAARRVLFLPERPYMVPGTLRDQFLLAKPGSERTNERVLPLIRAVGLEMLVQRVGGLDSRQDWTTTLSLEEQQQVAFARLLLAEPDFAFLDHAASAVSATRRADLYRLLTRTTLTFVSMGDYHPSLWKYHQTQIDLRSDGSWAAGPSHAEQELQREDGRLS